MDIAPITPIWTLQRASGRECPPPTNRIMPHGVLLAPLAVRSRHLRQVQQSMVFHHPQ
jgi:hypothetical protein